MKKFLVVFASLGLALSAMAQDFNEAVETFNQAAQAESKADALNLFKQAYTQFVACGEEAEAQDKVEELKGIIPAYSVAVAKESIAAKDYDAAIVALEAAAADCAEFGAEDKAAEVNDLFGFTYKASAKKALAAKDAQTAFSLLKKSVEYDPNDGEAQFLLGRLLLSSGKIDEAKAAFEIASANGREADVKKQLFNYYYNNGQKAQQAKKFAEAVEDYKAALEIKPPSSSRWASVTAHLERRPSRTRPSRSTARLTPQQQPTTTSSSPSPRTPWPLRMPKPPRNSTANLLPARTKPTPKRPRTT